MSGALHTWYSLSGLGMLAQREAVLSGQIELKQFARLRDMLHADSGSVTASLRFRQRRGAWLTLELEYDARLELICQRCLEPMVYAAAARVDMGLLETASLASSLPSGYEPVVLEGERLLPARLIEDELIVSLPLVPRHARLAECGSLVHKFGMPDREGGELECAPPTSH